MAFHTRKVKIKALNDSKEIAVIIYINSISLSLLAFVEFALNDYHEVYAALFGLALLVGATLFLTLLFIPKVLRFSGLYVSSDKQFKLGILITSNHKQNLNFSPSLYNHSLNFIYNQLATQSGMYSRIVSTHYNGRGFNGL
jgi:hypothetical protein